MSDLCTNCGLCCTSLFFRWVPVDEEEQAGLPLPVKPERRTDKLSVFSLPCAALDDCKCTIYSSRPKICRTFECDLLEDQKAGRMPLEQAHRLVAATKRRYESLSRQLPPPDPGTYCPPLLKRLTKVVLEAAEAPDQNGFPDSFFQEASELAQLIQGAFRRRAHLHRVAQQAKAERERTAVE